MRRRIAAALTPVLAILAAIWLVALISFLTGNPGAGAAVVGIPASLALIATAIYSATKLADLWKEYR